MIAWQRNFHDICGLSQRLNAVEHKVLFIILGRYGVPDKLIEVIHTMYANINQKFTVGTEK